MNIHKIISGIHKGFTFIFVKFMEYLWEDLDEIIITDFEGVEYRTIGLPASGEGEAYITYVYPITQTGYRVLLKGGKILNEEKDYLTSWRKV